MTETEDLLRSTLQRHVEDAPYVTSMKQESLRRVPWKWALPVVVATATAVVTVGVVLVDEAGVGSDEATPVSSYEEVADLTGSDVGLALGLEPLETNESLQGCRYAAEYADHIGFCLDGVTTDPFERVVLAFQIGGYQRNDALLQYATLTVQGNEVLDSDLSQEEKGEAIERYMELKAELEPQLIKIGDDLPGEKLSVTAADVEGLTGWQVAERLSLWPIRQPTVVTGCNQGVGNEDVLYCLDDLVADEWTRQHIIAQLQGYEDNEAMHAYVDALVAFKELDTANERSESREMWSKAGDLREQMTKVGG